MFVDIPRPAEVRISNTQPELIMFYLNLKDAGGKVKRTRWSGDQLVFLKKATYGYKNCQVF